MFTQSCLLERHYKIEATQSIKVAPAQRFEEIWQDSEKEESRVHRSSIDGPRTVSRIQRCALDPNPQSLVTNWETASEAYNIGDCCLLAGLVQHVHTVVMKVPTWPKKPFTDRAMRS